MLEMLTFCILWKEMPKHFSIENKDIMSYVNLLIELAMQFTLQFIKLGSQELNFVILLSSLIQVIFVPWTPNLFEVI